jgi:hypothetical protein
MSQHRPPDPEKVEILVDVLGAAIRTHIAMARKAHPGDNGKLVDAVREALNAMASVAAMTVSAAPTSANLFDFFLDAYRAQIAACIEQKINPRGPKT